MKATLYFKQTSEERYESEQLALVYDMLQNGLLLEIIGSDGGTDFITDDEYDSEQEYEVEGTRAHILSAHRILRDFLDRPVKLTWIYPWTPWVNSLRWHLITKPKVRKAHRNDPPIPEGFFSPLTDDDDPHHDG